MVVGDGHGFVGVVAHIAIGVVAVGCRAAGRAGVEAAVALRVSGAAGGGGVCNFLKTVGSGVVGVGQVVYLPERPAGGAA